MIGEFALGLEEMDSRTVAIKEKRANVGNGSKASESPASVENYENYVVPRKRAGPDSDAAISTSNSDSDSIYKTSTVAGVDNWMQSRNSRSPTGEMVQENTQQRKRVRLGSNDMSASQGDPSDPMAAIENSTMLGEEDDDVSNTTSSDECRVDIRGQSPGSNHLDGMEDEMEDEAPRPESESPAVHNPLTEIDSNMSIEEIIQKIPSIEQIQGQFARKVRRSNAVKENKNYVKDFVTAIHTYREALNRERKFLNTGQGDEQRIKQQRQEAEVRMAWVQYYPLGRPWIAPFGMKGKKRIAPKDRLYTLQKYFFSFVEDCLRKGTLQDLRNDKYGGPRDCLKRCDDEAVAISEESDSLMRRVQAMQKSLARAKFRKKPIAALEARLHNLLVDQKYCEFYPQKYRYERLRKFKKFGKPVNAEAALPGSLEQLWILVESCMKRKKLNDLRDGKLPELHTFDDTLTNEPPASLPERPTDNLETSNQVDPQGDAEGGVPKSELGPDPEDQSLSPKDERVVTNGHQSSTDNKLESGEISSASEAKSLRVSDSVQPLINTNGVDGRSKLLQTDGSIDDNDTKGPKGRVLRELSPDDLNAQIRYFHFSKTREAVDLEEQVRCLCCGQKGHMGADCEQLICSKCGAYNMHPATHCDMEVRCSKCGNLGHQVSECSKTSKANVVCRLCNEKGHNEQDCELFWRTSGAPWQIDLPFRKLRLCCYECGGKGHLGNDCSNRRPGKPLGTSTWSTKRKMPPPQTYDPDDETDGLNIRGHAGRPINSIPQRPANNERGSFIRSKPPEPTKSGKIQISGNLARTSTIPGSIPNDDDYWDDPGFPRWTPINQTASLGREVSMRTRDQPNNFHGQNHPGPPAANPPLPREPPPPLPRQQPPQFPTSNFPDEYNPRSSSYSFGATDNYQPQNNNYRPPPPPPPTQLPTLRYDPSRSGYQQFEASQAYQHPPSYQPQGQGFPGQVGAHGGSRPTDTYRPMPSAARNAWSQQWR